MKTFFCLLIIILPQLLYSQSTPYFQQRADVHITVSLNTSEKTLDGFITIDYTNNAPDTLHYIWIHLWPNAYKNDQTAFSEQLLQNGRTDFYFSDESEKGYINRLNFEVNGKPATLEDHPLYIDVTKLVLPEPLAPGKSVNITSPFHEKIPFQRSRLGYNGDYFALTQWFPKPAVYDREGWHPMPYLDQGEFYSEFGNYKVEITVPRKFEVAATGTLINKSSSGNTVSFTYEAQQVHDFAWFASPTFKTDSTTMTSVDGHTIRLYTYYNNDAPASWKKSIEYLKDAITDREAQLGPYPYPVAKVVAAQDLFTSGMEYPMITAIGQDYDDMGLDEVINHEAGHFWLYGVIANNERDYAWMDEGLNTYFTNQYILKKYGTDAGSESAHTLDLLFASRKDIPINSPSSSFTEETYYSIEYQKTADWLNYLKAYIGEEAFGAAMKDYYNIWKFRHPQPDDLQAVFRKHTDKDLTSTFALLSEKGPVSATSGKKLKTAAFFDFDGKRNYNYLFFAPVPGYNHYDKLMLGLVMHNYTLPEPSFTYLLAPLYATGTNTLNGLGRMGYKFRSYGKIRELELGLNAAKFTIDAFTDSTGKKNYMGFHKIVPTLKLTFRNKDSRSTATASLQWKTYFISETSLLFARDTILDEDIITYPVHSRYLNQLSFSYADNRALYPYNVLLRGEQSDNFLKLYADINYYFNFVKGGGLEARLFAGKFIYTGGKTIQKRFGTSRYHFNMTGPNGEEDYTYSNYFIGRNEFQGMPSQQIMIADGGFKVRTDLLSSKIGRSDNWLAAINLKTDIPRKINPLQIIPVKTSLKVFLDIGTHGERWKKENEDGKFLYDAGLQLSLFSEVVNIYLPILYSSVYGDYIKSTIPKNKRFTTMLSFSIDIQKLSLKNAEGIGDFKSLLSKKKKK